MSTESDQLVYYDAGGYYETYGQNQPAYSFSGCSVWWVSTRAFAGPVASGWMLASGWAGMIISQCMDVVENMRVV